MGRYKYRTLQANEIRLVRLAPGPFDAAFEATIVHVQLPEPETALVPRLSRVELEACLPSGWKMWTTMEGRYLFDQQDNGTHGPTTWRHPDPSINPSSYDLELRDIQRPAGSAPDFEALSYACGPGPNIDKIWVTDADPVIASHSAGFLPLRANLVAALQHLRHDSGTRTLWIDALSMNQHDHTERSHEVARMASVYSAAWSVVVWLGTGEDDAETALSLLKYAGAQIEVSENEFVLRAPESIHTEFWHPNTTLPYNEAQWKSIRALIERQWWERLWIWQEIQLGGRRTLLQCGRTTAPWSRVRGAILCIWANKERSLKQPSNRWNVVAHVALDHTHSNLAQVLSLAGEGKTSDPRDKIYALLGLMKLSSPTIAALIQPDYRLPTHKVYRQAFVASIEATKRLTVLARCGLSTRNTLGPTWVPDVSKDWTPFPIPFAASGRSLATFTFIGDDVLEVKGVICGHITSCHFESGQLSDRLASLKQILSVISAWTMEDIDQERHSPGEEMITTVITTILAGYTRDKCPDLEIASSAQYCEAYRYLMGQCCGSQEIYNVSDQLLAQVCRTLAKRTLFNTKEGLIGLGPKGLNQGDQLAVLLGCDSLVVVRSLDCVNYQVVGVCYVDGLMNCEALLGALPSGWRMEMYKQVGGAGFLSSRFCNTVDGTVSLNDPRIGPGSNDLTRPREELHTLLMEAIDQRGYRVDTLRLV